ncbi:MAG: C4-dicarboxylate transporter DctA, partial [Alsobacter sp.]
MADPTSQGHQPFYRYLYVQVLVGIALGATLGHFQPDIGTALKPLADLFI